MGRERTSVDGKAAWRQDHDHLLHPWTHFDSFRSAGSLVMESAAGCYVFDINGTRYLDAIGGLWCVNIGHGREAMAQAMAKQARRLAYFNPFVDMSSVPAAQLAAKLAELAPGRLNHVFFTTGGSTGIDTAFRLSQFYQHCRGMPSKRHVITRREAYHGSTFLAMSLGGKSADRVPGFEFKSDTIHHVSAPNLYRRPNNLSEAEFCDALIAELEAKILELGPENVSTFFAEPIMGAGGVLMAPPDYLLRAWDTCRRYDVLFVVDEVVTAFGRLGHMFASEAVFGVQPDMIVCAKGLTSGYVPLGAVIFSDAIHEAISAPDPDRVFAHGFTYSGHPVASAAALQNIEILEQENICAHVRELGPYFEEQLSTLRELPIIGDVRGRCFMMCLESVADRATKALFPPRLDIGKMISNHAERRHLLVRPIVHLNILSPPLVITREQIDFAVDMLRESILASMNDLRDRGYQS